MCRFNHPTRGEVADEKKQMDFFRAPAPNKRKGLSSCWSDWFQKSSSDVFFVSRALFLCLVVSPWGFDSSPTVIRNVEAEKGHAAPQQEVRPCLRCLSERKGLEQGAL